MSFASPPAKTSATIYDVAALAGVSPSTVSRALNQPGRITPATTERIRVAAEQLGFRFNPAARALLTGRTMTIGLVLADITNPVVFGVIRGAERAAAAAGYTLVIAESQASGDPEATTATSLIPSVDGLVLAMSWLDDAVIRELAAHKPLVLVNRAVDGIAGAVPDVKPGIVELLDHLRDRGHTIVAYVSGPERSWMNARRWEAVFAGARERGMSVFEISGGEPTIAAGRDAIDRVLASPATAAIAYNDLMAIGLLQGAQEQGVAVPDRLAIAGFDSIFGSDLTTPAITTVATPLEQIAAKAVERLIGVSDDETPLPTRLVVRQST